MLAGMVTVHSESAARQSTAFSLAAALLPRVGALTIVDQLVRGPVARRARAGAELELPQLGDLEEAEIRLVDVLAVAVAAREVVDDGPVVGPRPQRPLDRDLGPGRDGDRERRVDGVQVADDIGVRGRGGRDVAVVGGPVLPGRRVLHGLPGRDEGVVATVRLALGDDLEDVAVGRDCDGLGEGDEGGGLERHGDRRLCTAGQGVRGMLFLSSVCSSPQILNPFIVILAVCQDLLNQL